MAKAQGLELIMIKYTEGARTQNTWYNMIMIIVNIYDIPEAHDNPMK